MALFKTEKTRKHQNPVDQSFNGENGIRGKCLKTDRREDSELEQQNERVTSPKSSLPEPSCFMHHSNMDADNLVNLIQENITNNEKKLRRIHNIKVLLEKKYISAKEAITKSMNSIRDEFIYELDDTLKKKLAALDDLEKLIEGQYIKVKKFVDESSNLEDIQKEIEELAIPSNIHLLSFLSLDFVINDSGLGKNSFGYIKSSPIKPEDLNLVITNEAFQVPGELQVLVAGDRPFYPLLVNSLVGYIEDAEGERRKGILKENKDNDYLFTFTFDNNGVYIVSITLYGCHINNSPTEFKFNSSAKENPNKRIITAIDGVEKTTVVSTNQSLPPLLLERSKDIVDTEQEDFMGQCTSSKDEDNSTKESEDSYEENEKDHVGIIKAQLIGTVSYQNGVGLHFPIGVAVTSLDDIIICDTGHHVVWIVDKNGRPKRTIEGNGRSVNFMRPSAVSVMKDGKFVIRDNNGLHLFDPNGNYIRGIGCNILTRPFGLTVTDDDQMITINETRKPTLYVFNKDGQVESSSIFEPLTVRPPNSKCRFMASYKDELIVSDLGLSKVYKTTLDGKTILTFGTYGKSEGCLNEPSGIALDPKGTMLIGDSKNDRVQVFDCNGDFLGVLHFSHPIRRPSDITLTKDGRLFVLNYLDHYLAAYCLSHYQ